MRRMEFLISNLRSKRSTHPLKAVLGNHKPLLSCNDKTCISYLTIKKSLKHRQGSRPQQYRRKEEFSCAPLSLAQAPCSDQSQPPRGERVRQHCVPRKNVLCLETSGVVNECLPTAAPDIWRECGVSTEQQ